MKDVVKLHVSDVFQNPRVFAIELYCQFWCRDFGGGFPRIVFAAIFFSLDEILESSPVPMTVEYLLYFPFCFSVNDYGWWVVLCFLSCNQVIQSWSKHHYVEH